MTYNEIYQAARSIQKGCETGNLPCSSLTIVERDFISARRKLLRIDQSDSFYRISDGQIPENDQFTYPVFKHKEKSNGVILLLHGLNERTWDKYLPWAYALAEKTGKDVILFPISFHMERSPKDWINPRVMLEKLENRRKTFEGIKQATFANLALSERLTAHPERFMLSGYQSASDLIQLVSDIKNGKDGMFESKTSIDFFSYSIGAFLSQILFLSNPLGMFDQSRLFIFSGGAVFNGMNGVSKYIMDSVAFERIYNYYGEAIDVSNKDNKSIRTILKNTRLGESFYSMTSLNRLNKLKKGAFERLKDQIEVLGFTRDKVIPVDAVRQTLKGCKTTVSDPDYKYTHEQPFPLVNDKCSGRINTVFQNVMDRAAGFLA